MTVSSIIHRPLALWALLLCAVTLVAVSGVVPEPATAASCRHTKDRPERSADLPEARDAVLCLVNRERTKRGLKALKTNGTLGKVERWLARDMVKRHYFDHTTPSGKTFSDRLDDANWHGSTAGENIAWGSGDLGSPAKIVDGWMHSPGHKANILNKAFTRAGTAIAIGAPDEDVDEAATYAMAYDRP
jgi:uncharacterized protein YkwD